METVSIVWIIVGVLVYLGLGSLVAQVFSFQGKKQSEKEGKDWEKWGFLKRLLTVLGGPLLVPAVVAAISLILAFLVTLLLLAIGLVLAIILVSLAIVVAAVIAVLFTAIAIVLVSSPLGFFGLITIGKREHGPPDNDEATEQPRAA